MRAMIGHAAQHKGARLAPRLGAGTTVDVPLRNAAWKARSRMLTTTRAFGVWDDYTMELNDVLPPLKLSPAEYEAKKAPKSPMRGAAAAKLPRSIADRANIMLTQTDYERILGTNDLVGIEWLDQGVRAAAAVARILVHDPDTGKRGYATGFMVAPRLLLTNRHVFPNIEVAHASVLEFNYEYDAMGLTKETRLYKLMPDEVFIINPDFEDKTADFALVAVAPLDERVRLPLSTYGYLRLDDKPGKVAEQEFITIIQVVALHSKGVPKTQDGDPKMIVLRNSALISREELSRSSYSDDDILWEANLGIRISYIVNYIREQHTKSPNQLLGAFLEDVQRGGPPVQYTLAPQPTGAALAAAAAAARARMASGVVAEEQVARRPAFLRSGGYGNGYQSGFLEQNVPLPKVTSRAVREFGEVAEVMEGGNVLQYEHYSVIMNGDRGLAYVSACNIDGLLKKSVKRNNLFDTDPRIRDDQQTDQPFYREKGGDYFQQGHLTRRDDVCWYDSDPEEGQAASDQSFAMTNIAPQHKDFNDIDGILWGGLETYILLAVNRLDLKASVFNGPIFSSDDVVYKGTPVPKRFFKVVALNDPTTPGRVSATAYIISQASKVSLQALRELAKRERQPEPYIIGSAAPRAERAAETEALEDELPLGLPGDGVKVLQVNISYLEELTGLNFGRVLRDADVLPVGSEPRGEEEAAGQLGPVRPIRSFRDIVL